MKWPNKIGNIFKRKESQTTGIIASPGSSGVIWPTRNYDNFARETYLKNVTAFRAIDEVAKSVASVPWGQYRRLEDEGREIVTEGGIAEPLVRPNPNESWPWLMLKTTAYLVMAGNSFMERVGPISGPNKGIVKELYSLRPDRFKIKQASGRIAYYEYEVGGRKTKWEVDPITGHADVLQLKAFHPLDDWWGAAPTESGAREIDTSNSATEWNKNLLDNQGRPGMIYTLVGKLGADQFDQLERYLRENHGGPQNVGKDLILTGERGTSAAPYGWSPTDMDFGEGDVRLMKKIAMTYGVPPELLGIESATFNNRGEARLFFWENTVIWWLNYLRGELNNWLFDYDSGLFIDYILDNVPAFTIKRDKLWKRAQESDFLTINQKLEMVDMPNYGPAGDVILVEASKIPLGMTAEEETTEEEEEEKARQQLEEQGLTEDEIDDILGADYKDDDLPDESKPYLVEHACRLNDPGKYDEVARVNCFKKSAGRCIDYIFGIKNGKSEVQAMRYKKNIWTADAARKHCAGRNGTFEVAKKIFEISEKLFKADEMTRQDWLDAWKKDPHWATSLKPSPLAKELILMDSKSTTKGRILEIGCGNGRDSIYFGKQGHSVVGIDISPIAITIAKKNNFLENVQFEVGNAEKLRFDTDAFDAVYSLSVLHSTNLKKSISEVSRVLRKNGIALFYLYSKTTFFDDDEEKGRTIINFKITEMNKLLGDNKLQILDRYQSESKEDEDEEGTHIHTIIVYFLRKK